MESIAPGFLCFGILVEDYFSGTGIFSTRRS